MEAPGSTPPSDNEEEEEVEKATLPRSRRGVADAGRCALRVADFGRGRGFFEERMRRISVAAARYEQATPRTPPTSASVAGFARCLSRSRELDERRRALASVKSGGEKRKLSRRTPRRAEGSRRAGRAQARSCEREKARREVDAARLARRVEAPSLG